MDAWADFMMALLLANTVGILLILIIFFTINAKLKRNQDRMLFVNKRLDDALTQNEEKQISAITIE